MQMKAYFTRGGAPLLVVFTIGRFYFSFFMLEDNCLTKEGCNIMINNAKAEKHYRGTNRLEAKRYRVMKATK